MTTLSTYTTPTEVRAALGVSTTELRDVTVELAMNVTFLEGDLEEVAEGIVEEFATVSGISEGSRTAAQKKFYDLVKLYAPYQIAKRLLVSLPMFGVRSLTDGKAEFQRQDDAHQDVRDGIDAALTSLTFRLRLAYQIATGATPTARPVFSTTVGVPIATDPVTNA